MMKRALLAGSLIPCLVAAVAWAPVPTRGNRSDEIAIVSLLQGQADKRSLRGDAYTSLTLFDRLAAGDQIRTGRKSEIVIATYSGRRWQVGEASVVRVESDGVHSVSGSLEELPPVPETVTLASLLGRSRAGAVRIRAGETLAGSPWTLAPDHGEPSLANRTALSYQGPGDAPVRVEIVSVGGDLLFAETTRASTEASVVVPPGILKPGATYYWRLSREDANEPSDSEIVKDAVFRTLTENEQDAYDALQSRVSNHPDPSARWLKAVLDFRLGLREEACAQLRHASQSEIGGEGTSQIRTRWGCR